MAVRDYTVQHIEGNSYLVTWTGLLVNDTGAPAAFVGAADRSVEVAGTFGGATLSMQGSNAGAAYYTLDEAPSTPVSFAAAGFMSVRDLPRFIRPAVAGGDGSTNLTVSLLMRSTMR